MIIRCFITRASLRADLSRSRTDDLEVTVCGGNSKTDQVDVDEDPAAHKTCVWIKTRDLYESILMLAQ